MPETPQQEKLYTKDEVIELLKRRVEKSHKAFFERYEVQNLDELDNVIEMARNYFGRAPKEDSKLSFSNVVGLEKIKEQFKRIVTMLKKNTSKERHFSAICFSGEAGTGKTLSAQMLANLLHSEGILKREKPQIVCGDQAGCEDLDTLYQANKGGMIVFEGASDLFNGFMGRMDNDSMAYNLCNVMNLYRNDVITVFADTKQKIDSSIRENKKIGNSISMYIEFEKYTVDELYQIALISIDQSLYTITEDAKNELKTLIECINRQTNFAGARTLRNALEKIFIIQAERTESEISNVVITVDDIYKYEKEEGLTRIILSEEQATYEKQLDELIGLDNVKKQIKRIKAYALKHIKDISNLNLHMCFIGNPGTGKTEVAKLFAGLLYENGVLPENKLIQKARGDLIAEYVGHTAPKVRRAVLESLGGVLFIDEAYLLNYNNRDYGIEAIGELLKCMEEYRGKFAVIFAGYKNETMNMIESNPGLKSRINRYIDFPDYNESELNDIAKLMIKKHGYCCDEEVVKSIVEIAISKKEEDNFANAREVRNVLESLYEIQATRTIGSEDKIITKDDVKTYMDENKIDKNKSSISIIENVSYIKKLKKNLQDIALTPDYIEDRVVFIKNIKNGENNGEGTGFIISNNGLIATNQHVVEGSDDLIVRKTLFLANGSKVYKEYKASVIKVDKEHDIALAIINEKDYEFPFFVLSESESHVLDQIIMGGYPFGGTRLSNISFSEGKIISFNKDLGLSSEYRDADRIYVDITGVPGSSGSAVLDMNTGEVIGIYSGASLTHQNGETNEISFAMPIKYLWELLSKSKSNTRKQKGEKICLKREQL